MAGRQLARRGHGHNEILPWMIVGVVEMGDGKRRVNSHR